jgi:hypothetical protein
MRPVQERHQDYVLGPNQDARLASVAPGQELTSVTLHLDSDAPFVLRARAYRVKYDNLDSRTQVGLNNVSLRYAGPLRDFRQQGYIPQGLVMPYGGQGGAWHPLRHQILYPLAGVIQLDLVNTGPSTLTNLTFYFRGVKLFQPGVNPASTYPPDCRLQPFVYPLQQITNTNVYGVIQNLGTNETRISQIFRGQNDADFVLRYGQAGPSFGPFPLEVGFILRDENEKPYSNDYVHYETLFGPCRGNFSCGGTTIPAIGTGNALPSVMYPEIYVKKNHILWWDVQRQDSGFIGAATIPSFPVNLIGSKVYS